MDQDLDRIDDTNGELNPYHEIIVNKVERYKWILQYRTDFIFRLLTSFHCQTWQLLLVCLGKCLPSNIMNIIIVYNIFLFIVLIMMLFCLACLIFIYISCLFFYFIYILFFNDDLFIVFIHLITQMTWCWGTIWFLDTRKDHWCCCAYSLDIFVIIYYVLRWYRTYYLIVMLKHRCWVLLLYSGPWWIGNWHRCYCAFLLYLFIFTFLVQGL